VFSHQQEKKFQPFMQLNSRLQHIAIPDKTTRYVADVVNPLLEELARRLIRDQPVDATQYLSDYFRRHAGRRMSHEV
jgi:hypothetical protein